MGVSVGELKGVTAATLAGLKSQGIIDSNRLLERARTLQSRQELAASSGVDIALILALANRADRARLKGVGRMYSDLLEEAGVDTVTELAHRDPASLHAKLITINAKRQLTQRPPSLEQVSDFIGQANSLSSAIEQ